MKKCSKCGISKPEEVFAKTKDKQVRKDVCKLCEFNWDAAVRSAIRRSFARSPKVIEVMLAGRRVVPRFTKSGERHKVDAVQFECQTCHSWVGRKLIAVDHFIPVVSVEEGFQTWDIFIDRINCDINNLKRICENCHQAKSNAERMQRNALVDSVLLDKLEEELKGTFTVEGEKELKKRVNKFLSKTKADSTRERALKLKQILINKIEKED